MNRIFIFLVMINLSSRAQTPISDGAWSMFFFDEFNGSTVDVSKWNFEPPSGSCDGVNFVGTCLTPNANRTVNGGVLKLTGKQEPNQCTCTHNGTTRNMNYSSGGILSKQTFKYGYFEIYCQVPQLLGTSQTGQGYSPVFYFWPMNPGLPANETWSEIDIFEIDASTNRHTCNAHYQNSSMSERYELRRLDPIIGGIAPNYIYYHQFDFNVNFNIPHKFSCEWTPNYINFYYDDKLIRTSYSYSSSIYAMNLIAILGAPGGNFAIPFATNTLFPYDFEIDYIRVYKLAMDCSTPLTVSSSFNYATHTYKVQKSISMTNAAIPSSSKVTFRATDFIEINGTFEVPLGSEFAAYPTACH